MDAWDELGLTIVEGPHASVLGGHYRRRSGTSHRRSRSRGRSAGLLERGVHTHDHRTEDGIGVQSATGVLVFIRADLRDSDEFDRVGIDPVTIEPHSTTEWTILDADISPPAWSF